MSTGATGAAKLCLQALPDALILRIFAFLTLHSMRLSRVNSVFSRLAKDALATAHAAGILTARNGGGGGSTSSASVDYTKDVVPANTADVLNLDALLDGVDLSCLSFSPTGLDWLLLPSGELCISDPPNQCLHRFRVDSSREDAATSTTVVTTRLGEAHSARKLACSDTDIFFTAKPSDVDASAEADVGPYPSTCIRHFALSELDVQPEQRTIHTLLWSVDDFLSETPDAAAADDDVLWSGERDDTQIYRIAFDRRTGTLFALYRDVDSGARDNEYNDDFGDDESAGDAAAFHLATWAPRQSRRARSCVPLGAFRCCEMPSSLVATGGLAYVAFNTEWRVPCSSVHVFDTTGHPVRIIRLGDAHCPDPLLMPPPAAAPPAAAPVPTAADAFLGGRRRRARRDEERECPRDPFCATNSCSNTPLLSVAGGRLYLTDEEVGETRVYAMEGELIQRVHTRVGCRDDALMDELRGCCREICREISFFYVDSSAGVAGYLVASRYGGLRHRRTVLKRAIQTYAVGPSVIP